MKIWYVTLIGFLVGVLGTGLGSLVGIFIKKSDKILSVLLGLTGGFMMFIVSFHLFPEAFYLGGLYIVLLGVVLGILVIVIMENLIDKLTNIVNLRTGILLCLSVALHNFPEGLALGSTLVAVTDFGFELSLAMLLHNIPEGISLALPFSMNRINPWKIIIFSILAATPTGLGAFVGAYLGNISNMVISFCLALAGGIMLYIVCDDLIPTGKTLHKGRASAIAVVIGYVLGIILYF